MNDLKSWWTPPWNRPKVHSAPINKGLLAPREARHLGSGSNPMTLVVVPPGGRARGLTSHLAHASPAGQERTPRARPAMGVRSCQFLAQTTHPYTPAKGCCPSKACID